MSFPASWEVLYDSSGDGLRSAVTLTGSPPTEAGSWANHLSRGLRSGTHRAQLTVPAGVTETLGGVLLYLEPDNANGDAGQPAAGVLFEWGDDASNRLRLIYDKAGTQFTFERANGGLSTTASITASFTAATDFLVYAAWDATTIYVSANGAGVVSAANTHIPTLAATAADVGSSAGASWFEAAYGAAALIDGPLEAAEWSALATLRTLRPPVYGEILGRSMIALWPGEDADYFDDPLDQLTSDVQQLTMIHGRDYPSTRAGRSTAGVARLQLDNDDGRYSPSSSSSPLAGLLLPGRLLQVRAATHVDAVAGDSEVFARWSGFTHGSPHPEYLGNGRYGASWEARGPLSQLQRRGGVRLALSTSVLSGTAVGNVLDAAGWPTADRALDAGQETFGIHFADDESALEALRKIEASEGPGAFVRETADGKIAFEDRHHRLKSPHTVSQGSFIASPGSTAPIAAGFDQLDPLAEIFNRATIDVRAFSTPAATAVLWTHQGDNPVIPPGESEAFTARWPSRDTPDGAYVSSWTTLDATDVSILAGGPAFGDLTITLTKRAREMVIEIANDHATLAATLTLIRARGDAVSFLEVTRLEAEDSASEDAYGESPLPLVAPWLSSLNSARDFVKAAVSRYKDPVPLYAVPLTPTRAAAHLADVLALEVSDLITIQADATPFEVASTDVFVEQIVESVAGGGAEHELAFACSKAARDEDFIILDTGPGLGTGKLAY